MKKESKRGREEEERYRRRGREKNGCEGKGEKERRKGSERECGEDRTGGKEEEGRSAVAIGRETDRKIQKRMKDTEK